MTDMGLVIGSAECVDRDLDALSELVGGPWPGQVISVNEAGVRYQRLDHWATVHPEKMVERDPDHPEELPWTEQRARKGFHSDYLTWTHKADCGTDRVADVKGSGSSGFFAVEVALEVGCRKIVLCGVPMDTRGWFEGSVTHPPDERFLACESHQRYWRRKKKYLDGRVRSMSGWTRELLGAPTRAWLGVG